MAELEWDPILCLLHVELPLPPTDNNCHRSGQYVRYPTKAYTDWLEIVNPLLRRALAGWEPDREQWWRVSITVWKQTTADAQNYVKPLLDALSGTCVVGSRLEKPGLLWDDDGRVRGYTLDLQSIRDQRPRCELWVQPAEPPEDARLTREAAQKEIKRLLRLEQQKHRERLRQEKREEVLREREKAKRARERVKQSAANAVLDRKEARARRAAQQVWRREYQAALRREAPKLRAIQAEKQREALLALRTAARAKKDAARQAQREARAARREERVQRELARIRRLFGLPEGETA